MLEHRCRHCSRSKSCPIAGFVLDDNRADLLMVSCPLPPQAEWDDVMAARVDLLAARGLAPRIFLPAATLDGSHKCVQLRAVCMILLMLRGSE